MLTFFVLIKDQFLLRYIYNFSFFKALELTIFILGFVYINLMVRENHFAWLIGAFNCSVLTYIWFNKGVWGNVILYAFYVCNAFYAFAKWKKKDDNNNPAVKLKTFPGYIIALQLCCVGLIICLCAVTLDWLAKKFGFTSNYTYHGLFILIFSLYSLFLQVNKNIESWLFFTIIDAMVTILYIKNGIYLLAITKSYMTIMSGYGFIRWIINYNKERSVSK